MDEDAHHPQIGWRMIRHIPFLHSAAEIVLSHQERWDGSGYPRGLSGEAIPVGARIFAVADTYDAMTSDRLYQKAMEPQFVMGKLIEWKGSRYDPNVVDAMTRIYGRFLATASPGN